MNKVILSGRLGNAPELRQTSGGHDVANVRLATTESYKDKDDNWVDVTQWHNLVCWRSLAGLLAKMNKGDYIECVGKIEYREYEKNDGSKGYTTEIKVDNLRRLINNSKAKVELSEAKKEEVERDEDGSEDDLPF